MRPARPVRRYRKPAYPTRLQILDDPQLLALNLPKAWLGNAELRTLVGVLLAVGPGAAAAAAPAPGAAKPETQLATVAPIFVHGEGRGAIGCVVVSPPVFLSEEEALQVMREELAEHDLSVGPTAQHLPGVVDQESDEVSADLVSAQGDIVLEYISTDDYFALGGWRSNSSVQDFDMQEVARGTARQISESPTAGTATYGIFYDPMTEMDLKPSSDESDGWVESSVSARLEAKRLLRQQVRDFVDWLRAQGVI